MRRRWRLSRYPYCSPSLISRRGSVCFEVESIRGQSIHSSPYFSIFTISHEVYLGHAAPLKLLPFIATRYRKRPHTSKDQSKAVPCLHLEHAKNHPQAIAHNLIKGKRFTAMRLDLTCSCTLGGHIASLGGRPAVPETSTGHEGDDNPDDDIGHPDESSTS